MFESLAKDFVIYFEQGGFVMPPLVLITIVLWYALGYRFHLLKRGNKRSVRRLVEKYINGHSRKPSGIIDSAILEGVEITKKRSLDKNLRKYLNDAFYKYETMIKEHSRLVMTLVAVAPLAGLLGTVTGMIETFEALGDMTLYSQSGGIAGGISQALFTTQMGLVVAVPGLIIGKLLDKRQHRFEDELEQIKDLLCGDYEKLKKREFKEKEPGGEIITNQKGIFHFIVGQLVEILKSLPHEPENMYYDGEFQISDKEDRNTLKAVVLQRVVRDD